MIIAKLIGGLGNQMFQYALARRLALLWNCELKLDPTDLLSTRHSTPRPYGLNVFNIQADLAGTTEIQAVKNNYWLAKLGLAHKPSHIQEQAVGTYDANLIKIPPPLYLDGYWQSAQYFQDIELIIKNDFTLKAEFLPTDSALLALIKSTNSVALHIRRGDYVTNPDFAAIYNCCSLDYYRQAVGTIAAQTTAPHFFIFSDDIDWVKHNLQLDYPAEFVSERDYPDYQALILMSLCQHQIIANSSFSWWGAWLNSSANKLVIAPSKWFNSSSLSSQDIIPATWLKITL